MKRCVAVVLGLAMLLLGGSVMAETTTVLLVRHAEKAATGGTDPELTDKGHERAEALAAMLAEVDIATIYSTPFNRTRDTAAPVAKAKGLEVTITEVGPDFTKKLAETILASDRGKTVLVVGHSNTLGPTIAALGGGPTFEIDEKIYGDFFVCTIPDEGEPTLIQLRF